ncbi:SGNH/GDSL hydrolase family protein [Sunxiuqinia sp. A32]|uniref:SGNH/GDSL hydrolase family protein n=1 Tax=Sunxiuqinia sp. A32 TaxID=3461496 RepID=UPI0040451E69
MNFRKIFILIVACGFISHASVKAQKTIPQFKEGERVVFVGNSITHGGHYHSFIWLYYMTRFPNKPITVINAGIGGDCAWDIEERLEDDIFNKKPTYMTMTFGMNDVGYFDFYKDNAQEIAKKQIQRSFESYQVIEKRMQEAEGVTKVMIGGSPYDEEAKIKNQVFPTKNAALLKVNDFQRASAENNGWGFVDFARPMMEINQREQAKDSLFTLCGGDRIHPDNNGHMVMAYLFLKAQGLAGEKVADVAIDAPKKKVLTAENCKISDLKLKDQGVEFSYLANALPYPLDSIARGWGSKKSQMDAMTLIPFMEEFNQETLKVTNLESGLYQLKIDGEDIAKFSSAALQMGINLAELTNTPQYRQASAIMLLNDERFEIEKRFRDYAWMEFSYLQGKGMLFEDNQAAVDTIRAHWNDGFVRGNFGVYEKAQYVEVRNTWQKQMDEIVNTIYQINQPIERKFELVKVN